MSIISIIASIFSILSRVINWMHEQKMIDAGKTEQIAKNLQIQMDDLIKATKAREEARKENELHPEKIKDDDDFRRE